MFLSLNVDFPYLLELSYLSNLLEITYYLNNIFRYLNPVLVNIFGPPKIMRWLRYWSSGSNFLFPNIADCAKVKCLMSVTKLFSSISLQYCVA